MEKLPRDNFNKLEKFKERELKLEPLNPDDYLRFLKEPDQAIEQMYLSQPWEDWSLRLREITDNQGTRYLATLKSSPTETTPGDILDRLEIETEINRESYALYSDTGKYPKIKKLRSEIGKGITVDWFEDRYKPIVEIENPDNATPEFIKHNRLVNISSDPRAQNENIAFSAHPEFLSREPHLPTVKEIISPILSHQVEPTLSNPYIVAISGRSGSGKSTLARRVIGELSEKFNRKIPLISTDDYHVGARRASDLFRDADHINWDNAEIYDTKTLANELIARILDGAPIPKHAMDWSTQEQFHLPGQEHENSPIYVIEGLFADSPDLSEIVDAKYEISTPLATSVGRRIMRDMKERDNGAFGGPSGMLRYVIENAEPAYLGHKQSR